MYHHAPTSTTVASTEEHSAFGSSIINFRKVEWRSVFVLVTQRSVRHPSGCRVWPVRPSEPLKPPDGTWATSYTRACCRARAAWHDGSARLGLAWKRQDGAATCQRSSSRSLLRGKKFQGCERTALLTACHRLELHGTAIHVYICCCCFFCFFFMDSLIQKNGVVDLGHGRKTKRRGEKTKWRQLQIKAAMKKRCQCKALLRIHNMSRNIR